MIKQNTSKRSKLIAFLLCLFLGYWGIHNFYLGYKGKAITQLILGTVGAIFFGLGLAVTAIWAFVELIIMAVNENAADADGNILLWDFDSVNSQTASRNNEDSVSKIKKLKALLDDGTISKEEFEEKKKQLLADM